MKITCIIRYQIDPFQRDRLKQFACNLSLRTTPRAAPDQVSAAARNDTPPKTGGSVQYRNVKLIGTEEIFRNL